MNLFQKTFNQPETKLKEQLSKYGLCPKDWNLVQKNKKYWIIKNKTDADFSFIGKQNPKDKTWEYITLNHL